MLPETLRQRSGEPITLFSIVRGYGSVLQHRCFLIYLGIITISYAGLFAWISGASVVLQGVYGLSAVTFGFKSSKNMTASGVTRRRSNASL